MYTVYQDRSFFTAVYGRVRVTLANLDVGIAVTGASRCLLCPGELHIDRGAVRFAIPVAMPHREIHRFSCATCVVGGLGDVSVQALASDLHILPGYARLLERTPTTAARLERLVLLEAHQRAARSSAAGGEAVAAAAAVADGDGGEEGDAGEEGDGGEEGDAVDGGADGGGGGGGGADEEEDEQEAEEEDEEGAQGFEWGLAAAGGAVDTDVVMDGSDDVALSSDAPAFAWDL